MTAPSTLGVFGWDSQFGIGTTATIVNRFDFEEGNLAVDEQLRDFNGLRGTRAHDASRVRPDIRKVMGQITMQPTANELAELLAWCFGGTPSGSGTVTYPLADGMSTRFASVDRVALVHNYTGVLPDKISITGSAGTPLQLKLDLIGQDETTAAAGTFPALALDVATSPFLFFDLVLTLGGSQQYLCEEFTLDIDNAIDKDRFFNSQTLTAVYPTDRLVKLRTRLPYGAAEALYGAGSAGIAMNATFTYGAQVLTFAAGTLLFPRKPIPVSRREIMMPIEGDLLKSSGAPEFTCTLAI